MRPSPRPRSSILVLLGVITLLAGCGSSSHGGAGTASSAGAASATSTAAAAAAAAASSFAGKPGFEGVPIESGSAIAPASTTGRGPVDGISCAPLEQLAYHIHAHLAIYVKGQPRTLPGGIGIPGSQIEIDPQVGPFAAGGACYYWLHTHAPDGIIHVESPTARIYTLGDFFDEWHQPLGDSRVGGASGPVSAYVNGKLWRASPRAIPLTPHAVIQLSVGQPVVPFHPMSWTGLSL